MTRTTDYGARLQQTRDSVAFLRTRSALPGPGPALQLVPLVTKLYNQLFPLTPTPVVAINRAVAVAEVEGADAAVTLIDDLDLDGYYLFHAIRADLLRRLGRKEDAGPAYEAAIARTENATEREFLKRSLQALSRA